ncbi:MAG: hypothetical protein HXX09_14960, partial [Bacteroidetes bacterium]|nr:hypothetical protein [Bacteroidota bacterium]
MKKSATNLKNLNLFKLKIMRQLTVILIIVLLPLFSISQTVYTFTNAGATAQYGPTQAQINTAYTATTLNGLVTSNSGVQYWTVPNTGTYKIEAYGAQGGAIGGYSGGLGAKMSGEFSLTAGDVIRIVVGQVGIGVGMGAGGGGGSFVIKSPFNTNASILVIAGGGGGASSYTPNNGYGGLTGTSGGTTNYPGGTSTGCYGYGTGGSSGNGGLEGCAAAGGGFFGNGTDGGHQAGGGVSFTNGSNGGTSTNGSGFTHGGFGCGGAGSPSNGYGGGGGGYSGGGGGGWTGTYAGIGGGGGSYNSGASQINTAGNHSGNGQVIITNLFSASISQTTNILCNGASTGALSVAVAGGTLGVPGSTTFNYTGSMQTWTVPAGITSITMEAWGAQGWSGTYSGGLGGYAKGDITVTPGQTLNIYVGGQGTIANIAYSPMGGGWNGGGNGQNNSTGSSVGGGGGASDIRIGGTTLANRVIVGPGGGGSTNNTNCSGGNGGGLIGLTGGGTQILGTGGTQSAGGTSGGALGQGGNATGSMTPWNGGGGGGYYGGGVSTAHGPGGGGSAYITGLSNSSTTAGLKTGNGQVKVTYASSYTYTWSPNVSTTNTATGLAAGTYNVTVTDGVGATTTATYTITQPTAITATTSQVNVLCKGNSTGSATVVPTGGTGAFSYLWTGGGTAA